MLSLSPLKKRYSSRLSERANERLVRQVGSVTRHDNRRLSRASRHSWQSGSALLPAYARGGPQIRPTHHLPASLMDGRRTRRSLCKAGMAAQITAYFILYPFVLSFRRAPSGERCDAPLCNGRNLHGASVRLPFLPSRRACGPYKSRRSNKWFASQRPYVRHAALFARSRSPLPPPPS